MPKDPDELGALWLKRGQRGEYMTGTINGQPVVVFKNDKRSTKQPDWRVLKARSKSSDFQPAQKLAKPPIEQSQWPDDDPGF